MCDHPCPLKIESGRYVPTVLGLYAYRNWFKLNTSDHFFAGYVLKPCNRWQLAPITPSRLSPTMIEYIIHVCTQILFYLFEEMQRVCIWCLYAWALFLPNWIWCSFEERYGKNLINVCHVQSPIIRYSWLSWIHVEFMSQSTKFLNNSKS